MDQELRALERAAASGDAEAETRLLAERVRRGLLAEGWLEAAARFGHEPARRTLGRWVPFLQPQTVARSAAAMGVPLSVRLLVEWFGLVGPREERAHLEAARAWAHDPSPPTTEALARATAELEAAEAALGGEPPPEPTDAVLRHPTTVEPAVVELALQGLVQTTEARWREVRRAMVPWVLAPPRAPPPRWSGDDPRPAWAAAEQAFDAALASEAVRERAERLRERRRKRRLRRALLGLAADLGDPAAWLAAERPGRPGLEPPSSAAEVAERLFRALQDAVGAERRADDDDRQPPPPWAEECGERLVASAAWPGAAPELVAEVRGGWLGEDGAEVPFALHELLEGAAAVDPAAVWLRVRADLVAWALGEALPAVAPAPGPALPARAYAPGERFTVGDRVAHPKFGEGRVTRTTRDKVEIAFADGPRTLVHGRGA